MLFVLFCGSKMEVLDDKYQIEQLRHPNVVDVTDFGIAQTARVQWPTW